jgi:RING finger/CHY zinc finger protein 1
MLLAPCCNEYFDCRFCHDKVRFEDEKDVKRCHVMDRHAVVSVRCVLCSLVQEAGQVCKGCGVILGNYWCPVCVFLDDEDKGQYHCDKCGICRVGGAAAHVHCDKCGICVKAVAFESHACLANAARNDCTVCLESLHTSREPMTFLRCGHGLHSACMTEFLKGGQHVCPLCKKSVLNEEFQQLLIQDLDQQIEMAPMPEEYRDKQVQIQCNDCLEKGRVPFHIFGLKCDACGSYNTTKTGDETLSNNE